MQRRAQIDEFSLLVLQSEFVTCATGVIAMHGGGWQSYLTECLAVLTRRQSKCSLANTGLESYLDAAEEAGRCGRTVASRVGRIRRLGKIHRSGRREGPEGVIVLIGHVVRPRKELNVLRDLIGGSEVQCVITRQLRRQVCLVPDQILTAGGDADSAYGPSRRNLVVGAQLDLIRWDA